MSKLLKAKVDTSVPEPVELPDDEDVLAKRKRRKGVAASQAGRQATSRASAQGTLNSGREYTRGTLG